jgi:hypothetical protein
MDSNTSVSNGIWHRSRSVMALLVTVLALSLIGSSPAQAVPGEVLGRGSDIVGEVHLSNNRLRANFDNVGDCVSGMTCTVQVRWRYDNLDDANPLWTTGGWRDISRGVDSATFCPGNSRYRAELQMRIKYTSASTRTVEFWGQGERVITVSGGVVTRTLGKFVYDVSNKVGLRAGVHMQTTTASTGYGPVTTAATSGGSALRTSC